MSACGLVVASSTPKTPHRNVIPSSPDLPSPTQLFGPGTEAMRSGAKLLRLSAGDNSSFETASALLKREIAATAKAAASQSTEPVLGHPAVGKENVVLKTNAPNAKEATGTKATGPQGKEVSTGNAKADSTANKRLVDRDTERGTRKKEQVTKTKEKKPSEVLAQARIAPGKVTKPSTSKGESTAKPKNTKRVVPCLKESADCPPISNLGHGEEDASLGIRKALARRLDWTPTKDNKGRDALLQGAEPTSTERACNSSAAEAPYGQGLASVVGKYSYGTAISASSLPTSAVATSEKGLKKRKIELLNPIMVTSKPSKPKTPKQPKRKPQTITEKATGPYQEKILADEPSVLSYFSSQEKPRANPRQGRVPAASPLKEAGLGNASKQSRATASREDGRQQPKAPQDAIKMLADQSFTFGTSSQLAQEPATAGSDCIQQGKLEPSALTTIYEKDCTLQRDGSAISLRFKGTRSLWSAAARDIDGSLLDNENISFLDESASGPPDLDTPLIDMRKVSSEVLTQAGFIDLEEIEKFDDIVSRSPTKTNAASSAKPASSKPVQHSVSETALRKRFKRDLATQPPKTDASSTKRRSSAKKGQDLCGDRSETMPEFSSYALADLNYALKSLGFKPIRRREIMVETLQQCWESKRRLVLESMDPNKQRIGQKNNTTDSEKLSRPRTNAPAENRKNDKSAAAESENKDEDPPRRQRGRPRKDIDTDPDATPKPTMKSTKKRKPHSPVVDRHASDPATEPVFIEEQSATAPVGAPLPPNPPRQPATQPLASTTSIVPPFTRTASSPEPGDVQGYLFSKITEAVLSEPPTHDATRPSWQEKILMYDPIVLEDLAAWLNAGALGRAGCDDEAGLDEVKEWCRARSVCCVGRLTLRGQARQRL